MIFSLGTSINNVPRFLPIFDLITAQWPYGLKNHSLHYWCAPRGPRGVKKSEFFFYKKNCWAFVLKLPQKGTNFENCQKWKKMSKKPCFLRLFWIFFNLGAILAHQTTNGVFSGSWRIFRHPWHPWGRTNSGDISFLIFVFVFSVWQRHLADFFHYSQIEARCHLYWFGLFKSDNITFHSQNG
jgi:hypothetical protein